MERSMSMSSRLDQGAAEKYQILTADETVRTTDEIVCTTDEMVRTTDDTIERVTLTEEEAAEALVEAFGEAVDADYLPGKTRFRDALEARFELSELMAEELCDALERSGRIRFVSGAEGAGWQLQIAPAIEPGSDAP
jgi:hypothetical protein